jgi:hypothetical protein
MAHKKRSSYFVQLKKLHILDIKPFLKPSLRNFFILTPLISMLGVKFFFNFCLRQKSPISSAQKLAACGFTPYSQLFSLTSTAFFKQTKL